MGKDPCLRELTDCGRSQEGREKRREVAESMCCVSVHSYLSNLPREVGRGEIPEKEKWGAVMRQAGVVRFLPLPTVQKG